MAVASLLGRGATVAALLALTTVAGLVDAVSSLRLSHSLVANMTGNVVFLGFSVAPHSGLSPGPSSVAIGSFLLGAVPRRRCWARQRRCSAPACSPREAPARSS